MFKLIDAIACGIYYMFFIIFLIAGALLFISFLPFFGLMGMFGDNNNG